MSCVYCEDKGVTIGHNCPQCIGRHLARLATKESAENTARKMEGMYPFTARQMTDAMDEYRRERRVA